MRSLQRHEEVLIYYKVSMIMRDLGSHIIFTIATLVFKVCLMQGGGEQKGVKERAMPFLRFRVLL